MTEGIDFVAENGLVKGYMPLIFGSTPKSAIGVFFMIKKKFVLKIDSYSTKDGLLSIKISDEGLRAVVKSVTDVCQEKYGGYIQLEMSPPYKKRTLSMNDKWWAMCTDFGNYCGMTKDDVAMAIKCCAMDEGLWEGIDMPFSKNGKKFPKSTKNANTTEMSALIDVLYRIAAEYGYDFEQ